MFCLGSLKTGSESVGLEVVVGSGNKAICFWFVTMLVTGIMMLKDADKPKMLVVLVAFCFLSSAWLFMDGLITVIKQKKHV